MPDRSHVAVVTCHELPVPAPDDALLVDALGAEGVTATLLPWDADAGWGSFAGCVLRSPWDYHHRLDEFLDWVRRVGAETRVWNPPAVVADNAHKRYLLGLADAGVPVVPTTVLPRRSDVTADVLLDGHGDLVVKPAVSAGAHRTHRVRAAGDLPADELTALLDAGDVLLQPFVRSIATHGETAVVWLDGGPAHAWRKRPADGDFRVQLEHGGNETTVEAAPAELAVAEAAMATVLGAGHDVLYGRVDLVELEGEPHVMELELIEPDLRLREHPASLAWLAAAVARRVRADT
jgi:glutathione synthase/RimK-type ligase-like ATP-grasp enzyme